MISHEQLFARCTFPDAEELHCAVSGGADSMAMLVLASKTGRNVTAYHVDHGLRVGSSRECDVVRKACDRFGATCISLCVEIPPGANLEARARAARYAALPTGVLTGHTADDQAETLLINLLRGAGIDGLAAMRTEARPILHLRRAETHELCKSLEIETVHDASNDDPAFVRNRVRHELMPLLNSIAARDVVPVLARQSKLLRDDARLLQYYSDDIDPTDALALHAAPPELARRVLRSWLREVGGEELHPPSLATVDRVLRVVRGEAIACDVTNGFEVRRTAQRLRLVQRLKSDDDQK